MPECQKLKNGRLGLYGAEHSKCNHMMTLGFKGLKVLDVTDTSAATSDFAGAWSTEIMLIAAICLHVLLVTD